MPRNDNPHAQRLLLSVAQHVDADMYKQIYDLVPPLSSSADFKKKFVWAKAVCGALSELDDDSARKIRMDCSCGPDTEKMEKLKKLYGTNENVADFAAGVGRLNLGYTVEVDAAGNLLLVYPECYCSCVKRVPDTLPQLWCYCTLGYTKRMFEFVLDREVDVELVESVKTGGTRCVIRVI